MDRAFVAVSSNFEASDNIKLAIECLSCSFENIVVSNVYQNAAIGKVAADYFNLVISIEVEPAVDTEATIRKLIETLKGIESALGRLPKSEANGEICIDLDLIIFADYRGVVDGYELPSGDILKHNFILKPLSEISNNKIDCCSQSSYQTLWNDFAESAHALKQVDL